MRRIFLFCVLATILAAPMLSTPVLSASVQAGENADIAAKQSGTAAIQGIPKIEDFMFCEGLLKKGCDLFKAKKYEDAFAQFNRWAERGEAGSMNNMGVMLEAGLGVEADFKRAQTLYLLASEADVAIAQYNLGMFLGARYMDSAHAQRKLSKAEQSIRAEDLLNSYKWLRLAAHQGHNKAMAGADELEPYMTEKQIELALHRVGWVLRNIQSKENRYKIQPN